MLGKLFGADQGQAEAAAVAGKPAGKAAKPAADRGPWEARLADADADDATLLRFALDCPFADLKVAAVAKLRSEEALQEAETAFRDHHRRAHREAKQRLEKLHWTRKTRQRAAAVIAEAQALRTQSELGANKLVELDRAWSALDLAVLEPQQIADYDEHWQALSKGMRARGDLLVRTTRWAAAVQTVMREARRAARAVADGSAAAATLDAHRDQLAQSLAEAPSGEAALDDSDLHALAMAQLAELAALAGRAAFLEHGARTPEASPDEAAWAALPALADAALARPLQERFSAWSREARERVASARADAQAAQRAAQKALDHQRRERLGQLAGEAERHLADGHVADALRCVKEIDRLQIGSVADRALAARIQHLHAEIGRLKQWQQWGGGRARDDLLLEAKVLEAAATDTKLHLRGHAQAIDKLRERWKELDKLGAPSPQALWRAFDGALKKAHEPVEAFQKRLKEQRDENLGKRNALIAGLEAFLPGAGGSPAGAAAGPGGETDLRSVARRLDHFDMEWRKLGPLEHTVPKKALDGLLRRLDAARKRLEEPLIEARRVETLRREKLIAAAKAIDPKARDAVSKSRELQNEWQARAKALPLAREEENALWRPFKDAIDAVFKAREAEHQAREQGFSASAKARQALIEALRNLGPEHGPAHIRQVIGETDAAWRKAGEAKREEVARLEAQFRAAKDAARRLLEESAARDWQATCDALVAKLAFAREVEAGMRTKSDEQWRALRTLPAAWESALRARLDSAAEAADPLLLLRLEDALDVPSPPSQAEARRALKLKAMKAALEGRVAVGASDAELAAWVAALCKDPTLQAEDRLRLDRLVGALRRKPLRI